MFKKIALLLLVLISVLSISASALYIKTGEKIYIPSDTIINDNLLAIGERVTVDGIVKGDLLVLADTVLIRGTVEGDVFAIGAQVDMRGEAKNIFVTGGEVFISGVSKHDLLVAAGKFFLHERARIGKDAFVAGGQLDIAGKIYRDLRIGGGEVVLAPTALVKGKIDHTVGKLAISDRARVVGAVTSFAQPKQSRRIAEFFGKVLVAKQIFGFLSMLLLGILAVVLFSDQVKTVANKMTDKFWRSLGWGILSMILLPLAVVLLLITIIGIPVGIILFFLYIFAIYIAGIFASVVIGQSLLARLGRPNVALIWSFVIGLIILKLIGMIPFVGWLIGLVLFIWAFGAVVSTRFGTQKTAVVEDKS